ncbi:hypothetical protein NLJ89_g3438 [Agrocybe chaxingu]|uniref:Uncharacterized protein n=1 Tax=Agrocybe chaxingu TaxID=84603 RepID=A0A9W8MYH4_9AGAR|nr:hypothetical protein NLJ89_g3438 [Agrocybe chaxingu]
MVHISNTTTSYLKSGLAPPTPTTPLSSNRTLHGKSLSKINKERRFYLPEGPTGGRGLNDRLLGTKIADGWTEYIHPEGKPYFHHKQWRVVTEANLRNPEVVEKVKSAYLALVEMWNEVEAEAKNLGDIGGEGLEIFIVLCPEAKYYFVDHERQNIFWLTDISLGEGFLGPMDAKEGVAVGVSDSLFQQQYYAHLAAFPCHNQVPEDGVQFLLEYLQFAHIEGLIKGFNLAPWDSTEAKTLLSRLNGLLNTGSNRTTDGFKTFIIARLLVAARLSPSSSYLSLFPDIMFIPDKSRAANCLARLRAIENRPTSTSRELPLSFLVCVWAALMCAVVSLVANVRTRS